MTSQEKIGLTEDKIYEKAYDNVVRNLKGTDLAYLIPSEYFQGIAPAGALSLAAAERSAQQEQSRIESDQRVIRRQGGWDPLLNIVTPKLFETNNLSWVAPKPLKAQPAPVLNDVALPLAAGAAIGGAIALNRSTTSDIDMADNYSGYGRGLDWGDIWGLLGAGGKGATALKVGSYFGPAGLALGGAYAGEQLLEFAGVRGGAGLIGSRPSKRIRKMDPANAKAALRASRRLKSTRKLLRKIESSMPKIKSKQKSCSKRC